MRAKQIRNPKSQMFQTSRNVWTVLYFGHLKFNIASDFPSGTGQQASGKSTRVVVLNA
jgi:hypothetical protein